MAAANTVTYNPSTRRKHTWLASYNARVQLNGLQNFSVLMHRSYWTTPPKQFPRIIFSFLVLILSIAFGEFLTALRQSCARCKVCLIMADSPAPATFRSFRWTRESSIPPVHRLLQIPNTSIRRISSSSRLKAAATQLLQPSECWARLAGGMHTEFHSSLRSITMSC